MARGDARGCLTETLIRWGILAAAIALTAWLLPDVDAEGGFFTVLWIAVIFGLVNAILGLLLRVLTLPLILLTFGLFSLVINAIIVLVTDWLSDDFTVDGFWTALLAAIIISIVSFVLSLIFARRVS